MNDVIKLGKPDMQLSLYKQPYIVLLLNSPPKFTETMLLDTVVHEGTRFNENAILDVKTHFKQTETFQPTHFAPCHPLICQRRSL